MRLVTRADFDGLACGALITKFENIDSYLFVEPKFMQDGLVEVRHGDIIANLPFHSNCTLWFDHHITNTTPQFDRPSCRAKEAFASRPAPRVSSASITLKRPSPMILTEPARLAFLNSPRMRDLLEETDKIDAGKLTREDVLSPQGYVLISMTTDGRNAGDEPYWLRVIELCATKLWRTYSTTLKSSAAANKSSTSKNSYARSCSNIRP